MREVLSQHTFEEHNLEDSMLSETEILDIADKLGIRVHDLIRKNSPVYKERKDKLKEMDEKELASVMAGEPTLIKRPLLKVDDQYVVGLDGERIQQVLS